MQTPFEDSYWIIPGKLMGGYYPEFTKTEIRPLLRAGVRSFIDLTQKKENEGFFRRSSSYRSRLYRLTREFPGITYKRFPIRDTSVPDEKVMIRILDRIDEHIASGIIVYLHCYAGMGRTGTVAGCYLMRHGLADKKNVLKKLTALRKISCNDETHVQSFLQAEMVENWNRGK